MHKTHQFVIYIVNWF